LRRLGLADALHGAEFLDAAVGQAGDAAQASKHFHAHLHGRRPPAPDTKENGKQLRIGERVGTLRQ
jgi:hypothetical protein